MRWNFLKEVAKKVGFVDRWVQLIMAFVRFVFYYVIINGHPQGDITQSRGIR